MTGYKIFFDSSAWLAYFLACSNSVNSFVEEESIIFTSVVSLFEVKKKLLRDGHDKSKVEKSISFIKTRSMLVDVDESIADKSAENSIEFNLPAIDSLIYTSAQKNNALLITCDNDFRDLKNVQIIE
ncbi:PIN domain-containing protein [Candidatus Woesearchaeota archaeon]|nr:PIN domain-containing protein [Candidatus Woesearchaeota archaeon]